MPPNRGPEWDYVEKLSSGAHGSGKNKCRLCGVVFTGGASRIMGHMLKISGRSVGNCTAEESKLRAELEQLRLHSQ